MSTGTGQVDNPAISAAFHSRMHQERKEAAAMASTADKILGLLIDDPIVVHLTEDVSMEFYPPSDDEYIEIVRFQGEGLVVAERAKRFGVQPGGEDDALEKIPQAMEIVDSARAMLTTLNEILARLSVDPAWTAEKFRQMPRKYKTQILTILMELYFGEIQSVRKFRGKQKR